MSDLFIPQGPEYFEEIITNNCYYVDKTSFLINLFKPNNNNSLNVNGARVNIFNRPRRFGKTLNLTMLRAFVDITEDNRELFANLKVSQYPEICEQWQNKWPVIFVSFKRITSGSMTKAIAQFRSIALDAAQDHLYLLESSKVPGYLHKYLEGLLYETTDEGNLPEFLKRLADALYFHHRKQVILIIDEYDVPISKAQNSQDYDAMIEFMRSCLDCLKTSKHICFAVLSGCLRLARESLFTGLNHFKCYSLVSSDFADDFGFTHEEVKAMLKAYDAEDIYEQMQKWYDGYNIGGRGIFNPWSTNCFLADKLQSREREPQTYWANTGSPEILESFIVKFESKLRSSLENLLSGKSITADYDENLTYKNLFAEAKNFWTVLFASGYLTLKDAAKGSCRNLEMVLPNREIKQYLISIVNRIFSSYMSRENTSALYQAFYEQNAEAVSKQITDYAKSSISYFDYGENFYHALTLGMFVNLDGEAISNREAGEGRPDIRVTNNQDPTIIIIEIKAVPDENKVEEALQAALAQIDNRKYAERDESEGRKVIKCALVYCRKDCFARFAI